MAVIRQHNWLGQQRVDLPHLRSQESGVAGDFDVLAGSMLAGDRPLVVTGFELVSAGISAATQLQIKTASSLLLHPTASESGTIFNVPGDRAVEVLSTTNARVSGSFTPNATNFVGVDLVRAADDATSDLVNFLDATTLKEAPENVPLARTLDYRIVIGTLDFAVTPHLAPVAKVVTDASNNVVSVEDARNMIFRLGSGGGTPNVLNTYAWPGGRADTVGSFTAADKNVPDLKSWLDAVMTRLWELGGGERWFSTTADRNVTLTGQGAAFPASGEHFEWTGTNLHWQGLAVLFDNSTGRINEIADQTANLTGLTDLLDGEAVYVDLDRTQNLTGGGALTVVKAPLTALGTPTVPGSRLVVAWRRGSDVHFRGKLGPAGSSNVSPATTTILGSVVLSGTPPVPSLPIAGNLDASNRVMAAGLTRAGSTFGSGAVDVATNTADTALTLGHSAMTNGMRMAAPGGIVMVERTTTIPTPATNEAALFFQDNGLSSPDNRTQLCVKWANGVTLVVAESDAS